MSTSGQMVAAKEILVNAECKCPTKRREKINIEKRINFNNSIMTWQIDLCKHLTHWPS